MSARRIGDDLNKWWITKMRDTWVVMPPVLTDIPNWHTLSITFTTGAEAHAAFARGGRP